MALLRTSLFGGALFAGALFGGLTATGNPNSGNGTTRPSHASPHYWSWVGDKFVYGSTLEAIEQAVNDAKQTNQAPVVRVANKTVKLPPLPREPSMFGQYVKEAVVYADRRLDAIKQEAERDEIAVLLLALGLTESDQIVIVG